MQTLIVEMESPARAKELQSMLTALNFVKKVSAVEDKKELLAALQEHEELKSAIVSRKNKAIGKYL